MSITRTPWLALALCAAASAHAADFYVDAAHGNDANAGTSWSEAWRTIRHAAATMPARQVLHIAPGVYDAAHGEVFPIPCSGHTVVGEGGGVVIDGGGASVTLLTAVSDIVLRSIELSNAHTGVSLTHLDLAQIHSPGRDTRLEGVVIRDMAGDGLAGESGFSWLFSLNYRDDAQVHLDGVRIERCQGAGARIVHRSETLDQGLSFDTRLVCRDSEVASCGVAFVATNDIGGTGFSAGSAQLAAARCRIHHNGGVNTGATFWGPTGGAFEACLVFANGTGISEGRAVDCTLADNVGAGLSAFHRSGLVRNCVVHGNGDDLAGPLVTAERSLIGDGDQLGLSGNITGDPRFVDRAAGDYRLAWGSPCVDTGDPTTPPARLDLAGRARDVDGDLDRVAAPDRGAFELAPLDARGAPSPGGAIELELFGPQGAPVDLWAVRGPPLSAPLPTPLGALWLPRAKAVHLGRFAAGAAPPGVVSLPLPATAVGPFSFQAVTLAGRPVLTNLERVDPAP